MWLAALAGCLILCQPLSLPTRLFLPIDLPGVRVLVLMIRTGMYYLCAKWLVPYSGTGKMLTLAYVASARL
jgi:hypothetical protein